jgi:hypothetical protein
MQHLGHTIRRRHKEFQVFPVQTPTYCASAVGSLVTVIAAISGYAWRFRPSGNRSFSQPYHVHISIPRIRLPHFQANLFRYFQKPNNLATGQLRDPIICLFEGELRVNRRWNSDNIAIGSTLRLPITEESKRLRSRSCSYNGRSHAHLRDGNIKSTSQRLWQHLLVLEQRGPFYGGLFHRTRPFYSPPLDSLTELVDSWEFVASTLSKRMRLTTMVTRTTAPELKWIDKERDGTMRVFISYGIIALVGVRNWVLWVGSHAYKPLDFAQILEDSQDYSSWVQEFKWVLSQMGDDTLYFNGRAYTEREDLNSIHILASLLDEFERLRCDVAYEVRRIERARQYRCETGAQLGSLHGSNALVVTPEQLFDESLNSDQSSQDVPWTGWAENRNLINRKKNENCLESLQTVPWMQIGELADNYNYSPTSSMRDGLLKVPVSTSTYAPCQGRTTWVEEFWNDQEDFGGAPRRLEIPPPINEQASDARVKRSKVPQRKHDILAPLMLGPKGQPVSISQSVTPTEPDLNDKPLIEDHPRHYCVGNLSPHPLTPEIDRLAPTLHVRRKRLSSPTDELSSGYDSAGGCGLMPSHYS